jgi:hypothetical protein
MACRWPAVALAPRVEVRLRQDGPVSLPWSEGRGHRATRAARAPPHQRWPVLVLTPPTVGCLPPAYWPPGSPEGPWCSRGELPDRQGRMSGTPPPRSSPRRTRFALDGLPGTTPRRPRSVAGRGRAFGACCFAGKLRSPARPPGDGPHPAQVRGRRPLRQPLRQSLRHSPATDGVPPRGLEAGSLLVMPPRGASRPQNPRPTSPPRGVVRSRRVVRFARLIQRRGRDLGGPSARAASGGNPSLPRLPRSVGCGVPG